MDIKFECERVTTEASSGYGDKKVKIEAKEVDIKELVNDIGLSVVLEDFTESEIVEDDHLDYTKLIEAIGIETCLDIIVFKIRDCHFEVTEINPEGITAKGLSRGEYIGKKFHC